MFFYKFKTNPMFNFFQNHERQDVVREYLGDFQDKFSEKQKQAIIASLLVIAACDDEFHAKEEQFLKHTCTLLGYPLNNSKIETIYSMGPDLMVKFLNTLDSSQKDWYIVSALGMVYADGHAHNSEKLVVDGIFEKIGIDGDRVETVTKKTVLLADMFS